MKDHEENTTVCFDIRNDGQYYTYESINNEIKEFDDKIKKLGGTVESVTFEDILKEIGVSFEFESNQTFSKGHIIKPKKAK